VSAGPFEIDQFPFMWRVRVYWEDTDAGGVVYHARYVRFFERARTEWLRSLGADQARMHMEQGVVFVVYAMDLRFLRPARMDDELDVSVALQRRRAAGMGLRQSLTRVADAVRIAEAQVKVACVDASNFQPVRIPPTLFAELTDKHES